MEDHHKVPFAFTKRGVYYFSRRIPKDLLGHYDTNRVTFSLKTKSMRIARQRSASLSVKLEEDWMTLRWKTGREAESGQAIDRLRLVWEREGGKIPNVFVLSNLPLDLTVDELHSWKAHHQHCY
jgi:hypothetical protein